MFEYLNIQDSLEEFYVHFFLEKLHCKIKSGTKCHLEQSYS